MVLGGCGSPEMGIKGLGGYGGPRMGWDGCGGGPGTDLDGTGLYGRSGMGVRLMLWLMVIIIRSYEP